jgi:aspartyl/asparaginyl-tRNA synthetase
MKGHAGFATGIVRATAVAVKHHHVGEAIPFPRMMERLEP